MFALEESFSRKRRRTSTDSAIFEQEPAAKRQRSASEDIPEPRHRPARFWDSLSKIRLSRGALREYDSRVAQETDRSPFTFLPAAACPRGRARQRLKRFARCGGPDLSHLRGFASALLPLDNAMSRSTSSGSRKRSLPSDGGGTSLASRTPGTPRTSPYNGDFQQKMEDLGVYTNNKASKPENLKEIYDYQKLPRASLSPSKFDQEQFEEFREICDALPSEARAMDDAMKIVAGKGDRQHPQERSIHFHNLERFDEDVTVPAPDVYYGASPSMIHQRVRRDLREYITPSRKTYRPAAPSFFLEGKSAQGRADVAKHQAMYDGVIGARAMHMLQKYGAPEPVYDNRAYSYPCTYQDGRLQIYATHLTQPKDPGGRPEYHMTKLTGFDLTGSISSFREGATAYRNTRDLAKSYRDRFIDNANQVAQRASTDSHSTTLTGRRSSLSALQEEQSETSADELVLEQAGTKRSRRVREKASTHIAVTTTTKSPSDAHSAHAVQPPAR